ncbi:MAG: hypothetical protein JNM90_21895, partial [Burkholderiales bacterium]|nr:hypothetical protein [Burkholderiales bacterium]
MRILAIHGVGHADARTDWQDRWRDAIVAGLGRWHPNPAPEVAFLAYDDLFEAADLGAGAVLEAFARLTASGLFHGIGDLFRRRRGLGTGLEDVRWSAGMVAQWVALEDLRDQLRARLAREMRRLAPDAVLAHSLGSLIAYDTFRADEVARGGAALIADRTLVTFGSQIGNPAVRAVFGGRVEELRHARFWWHLYNEEDAVFTCPIALPTQARFRQVDTHFDLAGIAAPAGAANRGPGATGATAWLDVAATLPRARAVAARPAPLAPRH